MPSTEPMYDPGRLLRGAGRLEQRQEELGGVKHAFHVHVEHPRPRGGVLLGQRGPPVGARVVHQDVERVPLGGHRLAQAPAALLGGQVGHHVGALALARELVGHPLERLLFARRDDHAHARLHEPRGDHGADAATATGDHRPLAGDVEQRGRAHLLLYS